MLFEIFGKDFWKRSTYIQTLQSFYFNYIWATGLYSAFCVDLGRQTRF